MKLKNVLYYSQMYRASTDKSMNNYSLSAEKWLGFYAESTGTGLRKFRTPDGADNLFWTCGL